LGIVTTGAFTGQMHILSKHWL